jgi:hypothetical protein
MLKRMKSGFRCPYEILGLKNKTILHVDWTNDRTQRLRDGQAALQHFYSNTDLVGITINLPNDPNLSRCSTLEELNQACLPYASELLAIQTDVRFAPLLDYQQESLPHEYPPFEYSSCDSIIATSINAALRADKATVRSIDELATYYQNLFAKRFPEGYSYGMGSISLGNMLIISPWVIEVKDELIYDPQNPVENKNIFLMLRSPLYPTSIGRYSKKLQVAITRHADITKLNAKEAGLVRKKSNEMIAAAGFVIKSVEKDQQNSGVWIPKMKY